MADPRRVAGHGVALLVNPASAAAHPGTAEYAERQLARFGVCAVLTTRERGHAAELTAIAVHEHGALTVVTLGGDGTVAEAAGALAGTGAALVPLPAGSTNVFSRTIGWPMDCRLAIDQLVRALDAGQRPESVTIGRVVAGHTDRVFVVNAGVGIDADAANTVERHPVMKRRIGQAWFAGATAVAVARSYRRTPVDVSVDGCTPFPLTSLSVACSRPYTYLGTRPFDLIPSAGEEGTLAWMGASTRGLSAPVIAVAGALSGGWHHDSRRLAHGVAHDRIVLTGDRPMALQADGEALGRHHHIAFTPARGLRVLRGQGLPMR
ncbi:MAG: hypothetical protein EXQ74_03345 [Thermoleophilia bacterium]|nr:hypothetical protein [Thermoleophilia bacterium]